MGVQHSGDPMLGNPSTRVEETDFKRGVCGVVVSYNIGPDIWKCVNSTRDQVAEVVIVDNGSGPETQAELGRLESTGRAKVIRNPRNEGIAKAMNQGAQYAIANGYPWVLTLDHDSEATPGMVSKMFQAYARLPEAETIRVGILGANWFDRNQKAFRWLNPDGQGRAVEAGHLISSGSLIRTSIFEKVGFFDEGLFIYYIEDDFCIRIQRAGLKLYLCPDAVLLHSVGFRTFRRFFHKRIVHTVYTKEAHYFQCRNVIHMLHKYDDDERRSRNWKKRIRWDFLKVLIYDRQKVSKLTYRLRGLWDGARGVYGPLPGRPRNS